jgi:AcrR family transcriptional regulator
MKKTKEKILDTARELFNESGYSQVTIRQIASAMGISSGNLNYHYRTRESILEALYFQMVEPFDKRIEELDQHTFTVEAIYHDIKTSMQGMLAYRFFWTDLYNLLSSNTSIRDHFESVRAAREGGYRFLFTQLQQRQAMTSTISSWETELLIERMIDYSNTWLYASKLYLDRSINEDQVNHYAFVLLSMLYPYLTEQGREEFEQLHSSRV